MFEKTKLALLALCLTLSFAANAEQRVLIVEGQNNHKIWPESSLLMKGWLQQTGLFSVDIVRTPPAGGDMSVFKPDFSGYDAVLSNYNGEPWPAAAEKAFEKFVAGGGGFVSVHAANNSFPAWSAYNEMIGIGGWGDRMESAGPYLRLREGKWVQDKTTAGRGGAHGTRHGFRVEIREPDHPIVKGLPAVWMHTEDELYDRLRGPAENVTVLASAYSAPETRGTGEHEPVLMVLPYGKGRVFHTTLGHQMISQKCVGFITTLQRGTEWAATGKVTQELPADLPSKDSVSVRDH